MGTSLPFYVIILVWMGASLPFYYLWSQVYLRSKSHGRKSIILFWMGTSLLQAQSYLGAFKAEPFFQSPAPQQCWKVDPLLPGSSPDRLWLLPPADLARGPLVLVVEVLNGWVQVQIRPLHLLAGGRRIKELISYDAMMARVESWISQRQTLAYRC